MGAARVRDVEASASPLLMRSATANLFEAPAAMTKLLRLMSMDLFEAAVATASLVWCTS